jgi:hypothetical protein
VALAQRGWPRTRETDRHQRAQRAAGGQPLRDGGCSPWLHRHLLTGITYHPTHLTERFGLFTIIMLGDIAAVLP